MNKIVSISISIFFLISFATILTLSTVGVETNKFNDFISNKINQNNNNISLKLQTINFKFDFKQMSLFLETNDPLIYYREIIVPAKNIKVYMDFLSIIKTDPKIKNINLSFKKLDVKQLKKLAISFKPSNLTSIIKNKINNGELNSEVEVYFKDNNLIDNYIFRGSVKNLEAELIKNVTFKNTSFNFFADKIDVLLSNIYSENGPIKIKEGDLKAQLSSEIFIETNFKSNLNYSIDQAEHKNLFKKISYIDNINEFVAEFNSNFFISFDKTYKVKRYNFRSGGNIIKATFELKKPFSNSFIQEEINQINLIESNFKTDISPNKNTTNISGKYSINNENLLKFDLESKNSKDLLDFKLNTEYDRPLSLELINYEKPKNVISNLILDLSKKKENFHFKEIKYSEKANSILVGGLKLNKNKFSSVEKILVRTEIDGKKNNDFTLKFGENISVRGAQYDATNLPKIINRKSDINNFPYINKNIEIDFKNIKAPLSENLSNFKLIGVIEKGKFSKISSKGDFGGNNFLDISMKKDLDNNKKYLEIYSDLTRPLLTEFSFFNGLSGGKLLYTSIIEEENSRSKVKIENFKAINAPGMIKLLSLADLGGLADLASGEGLSFDILEISMEKEKDLLKLNEILALGPSISVLMEGYQNSSTTSLRGTLVPAKTLNKLISKIPLIGDIVIPKEVGEGLFGISFKMKGPPGKIKTTINPIRTVTPRFIQKVIDRKKNSK